MKIAINKYGRPSFLLSTLAKEMIAERKGMTVYKYGIGRGDIDQKATYNPKRKDECKYVYFRYTSQYLGDNPTLREILRSGACVDLRFKKENQRTDPDLIAVIEQLGNRASRKYKKIVVVEIPDGVEWHIENHDGEEIVKYNHPATPNTGG